MERKKQAEVWREFSKEENIFEVLFCALTLEVNDTKSSSSYFFKCTLAEMTVVRQVTKRPFSN